GMWDELMNSEKILPYSTVQDWANTKSKSPEKLLALLQKSQKPNSSHNLLLPSGTVLVLYEISKTIPKTPRWYDIRDVMNKMVASMTYIYHYAQVIIMDTYLLGRLFSIPVGENDPYA